MTSSDELMILDDKIEANQAQYDLDKEAARISALLSKEFEKYEYLTSEELGYKPGVVEKAKFEYSPVFEALEKAFKKKLIKVIRLLDMIVVWRIILCITLINTVSLV